MPKTLFVINPYAGSGRGQRIWDILQPVLNELAGDYTTAETGSPEALLNSVTKAINSGTERIIAIGGDGTSNIVVNALMGYKATHPDRDFVFGSIPAGTGRDFARSNGIPLDPVKAARYILTQAKPRSIDVGYVEFEGHSQYFINISSAGISNDVVQRVERATKRLTTFFTSILGALRYYEPEAMRIELDGELWFEDRAYIVVVANNISFAQGIKAAPEAILDDGLFDVIVAENTNKLGIIYILILAYMGKHIGHPKVRFKRAKEVRVQSKTGKPIGMDFDGEGSTGGLDTRFTMLPGAIRVLM